ncbi:unnamed protein product [Microthlaspi erraticum]|uniref:Uncharacterized protein n=1 Tax=Microthlaspi erraticum TaxID=1685480 RepID=A0A6D2JVS1_9BRAS|nr:unnamed protein product [Microthlaspi erraticum]
MSIAGCMAICPRMILTFSRSRRRRQEYHLGKGTIRDSILREGRHPSGYGRIEVEVSRNLDRYQSPYWRAWMSAVSAIGGSPGVSSRRVRRSPVETVAVSPSVVVTHLVALSSSVSSYNIGSDSSRGRRFEGSAIIKDDAELPLAKEA